MIVLVNDESQDVSDGMSLQQLLEELGFAEKKGIAVAVNQTVVSRSDWGSHVLIDRDSVTLIQATQGG